MALRRRGRTEVLGADVRTHRGTGTLRKTVRRSGGARRRGGNARGEISRTDARRMGVVVFRRGASHRRRAADARGRERPAGESPRPPTRGRGARSGQTPSHRPPREGHGNGDTKPRARPDKGPGYGGNPEVAGILFAANRCLCEEQRHREMIRRLWLTDHNRTHSPLNFGSRFSMKAWMPSYMSSVEQTRPNAIASVARPAPIGMWLR